MILIYLARLSMRNPAFQLSRKSFMGHVLFKRRLNIHVAYH